MMQLEKLDFMRPVDGVEAFSTTRGEVDGRNAYSSVNLCDYVGDDALRVLNSRITLAMQLGVDLDDLVMPRQTHSCRVAVIDEHFRSLDIDRQEAALEGVDALVTTLDCVVIGVNTADCVPIVLVDDVAGVIAAVHAGWRGTVGRIARAAVEQMCRMGARADRIQAVMGPTSARSALRSVTRWSRHSRRRVSTLIPLSSAMPLQARPTSTCAPPIVMSFSPLEFPLRPSSCRSTVPAASMTASSRPAAWARPAAAPSPASLNAVSR